ncbi:unnamed protein product [Cyclocybe aegerita]|uniref:Uncharacterized protein n=1 Tax=Cyclocybe aegerita TaxID=1973307 RepID=A0A8S0XKC7_CYCAE|nr:unnamed protein product [Cyclocybe aegerita]
MDFSEAEHGAFIEAFVEFFSGRLDDTRTVEELHLAAEHLTRGCQEHYRASVTRVSRIGGAVPPEKVDAFKDRALGLLNAPDSDAFLERASLLIRDFPSLKSWMAWWMRPSNASRLFESERVMDIEIWTSLPSTTNAEEAMHWKLYCACGRNHPFFEGLEALFKVTKYFQERHEAASSE